MQEPLRSRAILLPRGSRQKESKPCSENGTRRPRVSGFGGLAALSLTLYVVVGLIVRGIPNKNPKRPPTAIDAVLSNAPYPKISSVVLALWMYQQPTSR